MADETPTSDSTFTPTPIEWVDPEEEWTTPGKVRKPRLAACPSCDLHVVGVHLPALPSSTSAELLDILPAFIRAAKLPLLRLVKEIVTPCAAVRKRKGILDREAYESMMRMTNPEQYELLREIPHRQTTPTGCSSSPLRVFLTGPAGCGKTFVLKLAMDAYSRRRRLQPT
ncbi:hypothetical protein HPB49_006290 [Dermacentor silvarum]|uniref:Uncharacterized protein n=1 Tax=Dermacentor silvarum TaxID=543639 RepID=A0ACB8CQ61_DERSI|nr:hypothetical protein HPB49_006290 [Dermacentor silvarum]